VETADEAACDAFGVEVMWEDLSRWDFIPRRKEQNGL
jgi:hypothetical protein